MSTPHPIPYQGSKRKLADCILSYLPADTERLIEPFAGSAAISLAAAQQHRAKAFVLGDINAPLMQLWHDILRRPWQLANQYRALWEAQIGQERLYYDHVRAQFNHSPKPHLFLYLLARCVKAAVRYNTKGEFNQSPDNRRRGAKPATMQKHILEATALLADKTTLYHDDYRVLLQMLDLKAGDVVYLDPPYQGVSAQGDRRYVQAIAYERLVYTLNDLLKRQSAFILSYDGRTADKSYGKALPSSLGLQKIEVAAGRSSQATLLGQNQQTYESLYLSPVLVERLGSNYVPSRDTARNLALFEIHQG